MIDNEVLSPNTFVTVAKYTSITKVHPSLKNDPRFKQLLVDNAGRLGGRLISTGGFKSVTNSETNSTLLIDVDDKGNSIIENSAKSITTVVS